MSIVRFVFTFFILSFLSVTQAQLKCVFALVEDGFVRTSIRSFGRARVQDRLAKLNEFFFELEGELTNDSEVRQMSIVAPPEALREIRLRLAEVQVEVRQKEMDRINFFIRKKNLATVRRIVVLQKFGSEAIAAWIAAPL